MPNGFMSGRVLLISVAIRTLSAGYPGPYAATIFAWLARTLDAEFWLRAKVTERTLTSATAVFFGLRAVNDRL
jgi:hypothetical protein